MNFWRRRLLQLPDFEKLEDGIVGACRAIIADFSGSSENREIYAFAISFDPYYSQVSVAWNSEQELRETLQKCDEAEIDVNGSEWGFRGIRYSDADFRYIVHLDQQPGAASLLLRGKFYSYLRKLEKQDHSDALSCKFFDAFASCMYRCIKRLEPEFSKFNRTANFIAFLTQYKEQEADEIELMRLTLSDDVMRPLFPAIYEYNDFCQHLKTLPICDQVDYWLSTKIDCLREVKNDKVANFKLWRVSERQVRAKLKEIGESATAAIVREIDQFARRPQAEGRDARSSESVVFMLLTVLEDIGRCERDALILLDDLLHYMFANEYGTMNLRVLAKTLHRLDPGKYPFPMSTIKDVNNVINWEEFGLSPGA